MSQRSKPHLPHQFVVDILKEPWMKSCKSFAFSEGGHRQRCDIVDGHKDDISAETYILGVDGGCFMLLDNFRQDKSGWLSLMSLPSSSSSKTQHLYVEYTILNMAIDDGDPLFAFESIRLGALVNATNGRGQTPLLQCLERMYDLVELEKITAPIPLSLRASAGLDNLTFLKARINRIALLLIEQHADVNATVKWQGKTVTPLYFAACVLQDFELVRLLLTHGANPYPSPPTDSIGDHLSSSLTTRTDLSRFQQLVEQTDIKNNGRPPRPCPCFSGKILSDCHGDGERHPYPDSFLCKCGSEKVYRKCCKGRNMQTVERWNSKEQWIQPTQIVPQPLAPSPEVLKEMGVDFAAPDLTPSLEVFETVMFNPEFVAIRNDLQKMACEKDKNVDPAFAWCYLQLNFFPFPEARSSSKKWCVARQKEWNAAVDRYIALGRDSRSKKDIERAAKIAHTLGALHRSCEAHGRGKVETEDVHKLLTCSGCKMSYYCSIECQTRSWKEHKKLCGTVHQYEPPLPSQIAVQQFVRKHGVTMMLSRIEIDKLKVMLEIPSNPQPVFPAVVDNFLKGIVKERAAKLLESI